MFGLAAFAKDHAGRVQERVDAQLRRLRQAFGALEREQRLLAMTEPNQVKTWTTSDGSRIQVGAMTDQHLFYALAKARRGEYPDSHARQTGIETLEVESFRRLRNRLLARHP